MLQEKKTLSVNERLELMNVLNELPLSQLLSVEVALGIPSEVMPSLEAPKGMRAYALFQWVKGSSGPGIPALIDSLGLIGVKFQTESKQKKSESELSITLNASFENLTIGQLEGMLSEIRSEARSCEIEIKTIELGSIKLTLTGSSDAIKGIQQLVANNQISTLLGLEIVSVGEIQKEPHKPGLNLSYCDLSAINISGMLLNESVLEASNVSNSNLIGTQLVAANLREANLSRSILSRANLSEADLSRANLGEANLAGTNLRGAKLVGVNFMGATLSGADLSFSDLSNSDLGNVNLSRVNLSNTNLSEADLSNTNLIGTYLLSSNLNGTNMSGAVLSGAFLSGADLNRANLSHANLVGTNLVGANLAQADLRWASLSETIVGAKDVTQAVFRNNKGLTKANKITLKHRGAIFDDSPGSETKISISP